MHLACDPSGREWLRAGSRFFQVRRFFVGGEDSPKKRYGLGKEQDWNAVVDLIPSAFKATMKRGQVLLVVSAST